MAQRGTEPGPTGTEAENGTEQEGTTETGNATEAEDNAEAGNTTATYAERVAQSDENFRREVEANRALIGDEGVNLLTARYNSIGNFAEASERWYDGLSEEGKRAVTRLYGARNTQSPLPSIGYDFNSWMLDNHITPYQPS